MPRTNFPVLVVVLVLGGCGQWAEQNYLESRATTAGANQLIDSEAFEEIDLVILLDPDGKARKKYSDRRQLAIATAKPDPKPTTSVTPPGGDVPGTASTAESDTGTPSVSDRVVPDEKFKTWDGLNTGARIDFAFDAFYSEYPASNIELRRNRLQERILAASNQRCNIFKAYVQRVRTHGNLLLGSLATVTGVVGSILTGAAGSRALAGSSGIFSGLRAEFNQELFQNVATQVITAGIDVRRRQVFDEIVLQGQTKSISVYTAEAAVKDALFYHGQCSVLVGFQMAQDSIKTVEDPGLTAAARAVVKVNLIRKIQDEKISNMNAVQLTTGADGRLVLAGTPLGATIGESFPQMTLAVARIQIDEIAKSFSKDLNVQSLVSDEQKASLIGSDKALDNAKQKAGAALDSCEAEAKSTSEQFVAAQKGVDVTAEEADRIGKLAEFSAAQFAAQAVNAKIRKVSDLFAHYVKTASERLREISDATNAAEKVAAAEAELAKATSISGCATADNG